MFYKTIAVCLFATACFNNTGKYGTHYNIILDPTMTPEESNAAIEATTMWQNSTAHPTLDIYVGTCPYANATLEESRAMQGNVCVFMMNVGQLPSNVGGHTSRDDSNDTATILMRRDLDKDPVELSVCIAHEMGHAFGLRHTVDYFGVPLDKRTPTLMESDYGSVAHEVTATDSEQYWLLRKER